MYDSIKLELLGSYIIRETRLGFKLVHSDDKFRKRVFNPDKNFVASLGYYPNITVYEYPFGNKWVAKKLEIQSSLPKLVRGSSYYEVYERDTDLIIQTLISRLGTLGIDCVPQDIERANVQVIAYCVNFYLPQDMVRPREFILPLIYLDVGKRAGNAIEKLWLDEIPGYGVKFHNNRRGIGFYDKVSEIENNDMQTKEDKAVLSLVAEGKLPWCFKIENTLQNRQAVKQGLAIFYDHDTKKERHLREVLQDRVALAFTRNVFQRLFDGRNVKALEQRIYPLEAFYEQMKQHGLSFQEAQQFLAHCIAGQQLGSLRIKQIADSFPYGRQYRQTYYDKIAKITAKIPGLALSDFFLFCKRQLNTPRSFNPQVSKEEMREDKNTQPTSSSYLVVDK